MPRLQFEYKVTVANVIQIVLLVVGGLWTYFTLVSAQAAASGDLAQLRPIVAGLQSDSATFNTRLTVVESRAETQSVNMDKLTSAVGALGTTVQSLAITSATTKTDVGYIRDYVEDQKRQAGGHN